jgi:dTMP kinase
MRGKFIVFEGVEGSGKTTQIQETAAWLQRMYGKDRSVIVTREPGGTELGRGIRQLLLGSESRTGIHPSDPLAALLADPSSWVSDRAELLLYAADRAQHVESVIEPHLDRGNIVLCDRFSDSTIAYQGYGRGFDVADIDRIDRIATGGLQSDLTLWLDLDVTIGLARVALRGKPDRIEQASLDFHQRVRQGYQELANIYPNRIVRIAADRSPTDIQTEIQVILTQLKWDSTEY